jgi:hypothetical protein
MDQFVATSDYDRRLFMYSVLIRIIVFGTKLDGVYLRCNAHE